MSINELSETWNDLIFTYDIPGWTLRGHAKDEKTTGWFQMTILARGCKNKQEAIEMALQFKVDENNKRNILK
jgi:hypothetical protein